MTTRQAVSHISELRRFELMYILQEKSDTHNTYTLMTSGMQQRFTLTQQSWTDPTAPEKKGSRPDPQHTG
jgi:hypothetical protein